MKLLTHSIDLMQTRSDGPPLWLTLGHAAGAQVPGGEAEAWWDDAATAGALGQRKVGLKRKHSTSVILRVLHELDGCCNAEYSCLGGSLLSGQNVLDTNNEGNEISIICSPEWASLFWNCFSKVWIILTLKERNNNRSMGLLKKLQMPSSPILKHSVWLYCIQPLMSAKIEKKKKKRPWEGVCVPGICRKTWGAADSSCEVGCRPAGRSFLCCRCSVSFPSEIASAVVITEIRGITKDKLSTTSPRRHWDCCH